MRVRSGEAVAIGTPIAEGRVELTEPAMERSAPFEVRNYFWTITPRSNLYGESCWLFQAWKEHEDNESEPSSSL